MKGCDVLLFAGTAEGRELGQALAEAGAQVWMCVATPYGEEQVEPREGLEIRVGRLGHREMEELIHKGGSPLVVDATHPYAGAVSDNIRAACGRCGGQYLRLLRHGWSGDGVVAVEDMEQAASFLLEQEGDVLLTVGSKELEAFAGREALRGRLYARVLPQVEAVEKCAALGIPGKRLICMQGPFSHEMNAATIRDCGVRWLVTKDSGEAGGFYQKLSAIRETGIGMVLVNRPRVEEGLGYRQMLEQLMARLGLKPAVSTPRFPLFVNLRGQPVAVVGGGPVASRRAAVLVEFGAVVTVVSPELSPPLRALWEEGAVRWEGRPYQPGDLSGARLAVAATDNRGVNRAVGREAGQRSIPVSVADSREESTFWFPALVRGGGITAGLVSDRGDHTGLRETAARIRRGLEDRA